MKRSGRRVDAAQPDFGQRVEHYVKQLPGLLHVAGGLGSDLLHSRDPHADDHQRTGHRPLPDLPPFLAFLTFLAFFFVFAFFALPAMGRGFVGMTIWMLSNRSSA